MLSENEFIVKDNLKGKTIKGKAICHFHPEAFVKLDKNNIMVSLKDKIITAMVSKGKATLIQGEWQKEFGLT